MRAVDRRRLSEGSVKLDDDALAELVAALKPYLERQRQNSRRMQALLAAAGHDGTGKQWFVLRVMADKSVDKLLEDAGIEHWMPIEKVAWKRPRSARLWVQERPLLPGYVFVRVLSCDEVWAGLTAAKGVLGVLCGSNGPLPVDGDKFMQFKAKQSQVEEDCAAYAKLFGNGDMVTIDVGPYASFPGRMNADPESEVGKVLVSIFGREVVVSVPLADIRKSS